MGSGTSGVVGPTGAGLPGAPTYATPVAAVTAALVPILSTK